MLFFQCLFPAASDCCQSNCGHGLIAMKRCCGLLLVLFLGANAIAAENITPAALDFFEKKIRPVLVANCYQCHSASSKEVKGNLRVDTKAGIRKGGDSGPSIVIGKPNESLLIQALKHEE